MKVRLFSKGFRGFMFAVTTRVLIVKLGSYQLEVER